MRNNFFGILTAWLVCFACASFAQGGPKTTYLKDFHVVSPERQQVGFDVGYTRESDGRITVIVKFNRPVDPASVQDGKSLFLTFPKARGRALLSWKDGNRSLKVTSSSPIRDILPFRLTLRGDSQTRTGSDVVKSVEGLVLDGNGDGRPGGNYVVNFRNTN